MICIGQAEVHEEKKRCRDGFLAQNTYSWPDGILSISCLRRFEW